jgi:FlaA1/EpsC-like NDP-sugar epimerase
MEQQLQHLFLKILGKKYLPVWVILGIDLVLVGVAYVFSLLLLSNFNLDKIYNVGHLRAWAFLELSFAVSFVVFRSYEGAFRHTGVRDLMRLAVASVTALSATFFLSRSAHQFLPVDLSKLSIAFLILHGFAFLMWVLGLRLFVKLSYSRFVLKSDAKKDKGLIIYGAGVTGISVRNAIKQDPNASADVVGFVDDNPSVVGKRIDGIKVYSADEVFERGFLEKNKVTGVVWSVQSVSNNSFHRVGELCLQFNLNFQRVPNVNEWIGGDLSAKQLRTVKIEDLLNRHPISLDNKNIKSFIRGKRVLVTGAAGSIGSEICRQVIHYGPECLVMLDNAETPMNDLILELVKNYGESKILHPILGDVTRENRIEEVFAKHQPEIVFHAAAYKHVPLMENNAKEAVRVNVRGTQVLAEASVRHGVKKFVMISTDKAVNPTNVMGATKRTAEIMVQDMNRKAETEFITTRFGNVLGSNGSVIPLFRKQIEARQDVTVTHRDIVRYFMTIPEAVQLVLEAGTMGNGGEIFVFDMGDPVRIYDLAEKMIKLSGFEPGKDIRIVETGLRPGEKLYEELLSSAESTVPTHHPKILIAKVREYESGALTGKFESLAYASLNGATDWELVKLLKELVPEYISQNSEFEKLD